MGIRVKIGKCAPGLVCCALFTLKVQAQMQISAEMNAINTRLANISSVTGKGMLISNKAMNIFLSEKVASYLSDEGDLSLYKNYVTLNSAEGRIAINHNFHQPADSDALVRSFVVTGARLNFADTYASRIAGKYANREIGLVVQKTWMNTPSMSFDVSGSKSRLWMPSEP